MRYSDPERQISSASIIDAASFCTTRGEPIKRPKAGHRVRNLELALNEILFLLSEFKKSEEEKVQRVVEPEGIGNTKKGRPLSQHEQSPYELTETEAARTGPAWVLQVVWVYIMASWVVCL